MEETRGAYKDSVGASEGRRPLGRHRHRWEDNIKIDLQEVGFRSMDWIDQAQDRDRWQATHGSGMVPSGSIKYGKFLD
jgi:hypothetical protein